MVPWSSASAARKQKKNATNSGETQDPNLPSVPPPSLDKLETEMQTVQQKLVKALAADMEKAQQQLAAHAEAHALKDKIKSLATELAKAADPGGDDCSSSCLIAILRGTRLREAFAASQSQRHGWCSNFLLPTLQKTISVTVQK